MTTPPYWQEATAELSAADSIMAAIIADYPGEILSGRGDAFYTLARSITGQQISVVVADAVWGRLEQAMPEMATITPQAVTSLTDEQLRTMGYSRQKISYLRSLADFFLQREQPEQDWQRMEDEQVIQDLIQIRGIGRWSAEMFLIFHLQRPDILPLDDIGLLKAIGRHYGTGEKASRKQARTTAQGWKPWRSVATWYLWRSLDPVPVAY